MTTPIHPSKDSGPGWTAQTVGMNSDILDRMERAVAKVRERLWATAALNQAGIRYAVAGGNTVASWVSTVDESAVRNTSDVDLLIRRVDLEAVQAALVGTGFVYRHSASLDMFLDGPGGKASDGVRLISRGKWSEREKHAESDGRGVRIRRGISSSRVAGLGADQADGVPDKDRTHLRDLLEVGLINASWLAYYPAVLASFAGSDQDAGRLARCQIPFPAWTSTFEAHWRDIHGELTIYSPRCG